MAMHWRGEAIFDAVTDRDTWIARFRDYLEGVLGVVEYPDANYPEGLTTQNNRVGGVLSGPAFTWSLKVPQEEYEAPPVGNGRAKALHDELSDLPETVAESGAMFGPIP